MQGRGQDLLALGGAPGLYKSPCGNETMTRRERAGAKSALALPLAVSTCANFKQMPERIGLAAHEISCQRGGRVLFTGLSFALAPGAAAPVAGPKAAGT